MGVWLVFPAANIADLGILRNFEKVLSDTLGDC